eukprot:363185-Chlamydomonas_euryale.AAC.7
MGGQAYGRAAGKAGGRAGQGGRRRGSPSCRQSQRARVTGSGLMKGIPVSSVARHISPLEGIKQRVGRCHKRHAIAHGPEPPHTQNQSVTKAQDMQAFQSELLMPVSPVPVGCAGRDLWRNPRWRRRLCSDGVSTDHI